jgi:hypothetical protein
MIIPSSPNKTGGAERQLIILKKKIQYSRIIGRSYAGHGDISTKKEN